MPISEPEWASITNLIEKVSAQVAGKRQDYFVTGPVVKVDPVSKIVWMAEFGDQPIPVVAFDYDVTYYDETASGTVVAKSVKATVAMPKVGDTIVVARELGTRRLPRLLGILQGQNWFVAEED
jgi:hypothetical protein